MRAVPPTKKDNRRKKLTITEEEFFNIVLLLLGPPKEEYFDHYVNRFEYGIRSWVKYTSNGQKFLHLVASYGEAKVRASLLYKRYARWCRSNNGEAKRQM